MADKVIIIKSEDFVIKVIGLCTDLERTTPGRVIFRQLLSSASSIGANVTEAQGAESRADFIHKMKVAYKEAIETAYWLRLIKRAALTGRPGIDDIKKDAEELIRILTAIIKTAVRNKK